MYILVSAFLTANIINASFFWSFYIENKVLVIFGILLLLLIISISVRLRIKKKKKKIKEKKITPPLTDIIGNKPERIEELNRDLKPFGFAYDYTQDIFYSIMDCWQRNFGYFRLYDEACAAFSMIIDCEPIYFNYNGKKWMIEFWKGQYGMTTGGEVGIYYTSGPILTFPVCSTAPSIIVLRMKIGLICPLHSKRTVICYLQEVHTTGGLQDLSLLSFHTLPSLQWILLWICMTGRWSMPL